jgi:hypothetical protein
LKFGKIKGETGSREGGERKERNEDTGFLVFTLAIFIA